GALSRTARLASLPISAAGRATLGLGQRLVGRDRDEISSELQRRTAEQVFEVLGTLKGGAMKFGQALSVYEAASPTTPRPRPPASGKCTAGCGRTAARSPSNSSTPVPRRPCAPTSTSCSG